MIRNWLMIIKLINAKKFTFLIRYSSYNTTKLDQMVKKDDDESNDYGKYQAKQKLVTVGDQTYTVVWTPKIRLAFLFHLVLRICLEVIFIIIAYVLQTLQTNKPSISQVLSDKNFWKVNFIFLVSRSLGSTCKVRLWPWHNRKRVTVRARRCRRLLDCPSKGKNNFSKIHAGHATAQHFSYNTRTSRVFLQVVNAVTHARAATTRVLQKGGQSSSLLFVRPSNRAPPAKYKRFVARGENGDGRFTYIPFLAGDWCDQMYQSHSDRGTERPPVKINKNMINLNSDCYKSKTTPIYDTTIIDDLNNIYWRIY